jgi:hypothetical protein
VQVDEPRYQDVAGKTDTRCAGIASARVARTGDLEYDAACHDDGVILEDRRSGYYRNDPLGLDDEGGRFAQRRPSGNKKALPKQGF